MTWLALGAGSVLAAIFLLLRWSAFAAWVQASSNGLIVWIATVSIVILTVATAWSRAVAVAARGRSTLASISPQKLRHPFIVGALGAILPGFGQVILGHFRRAACIMWLTGPLAAAVVILANWRWLWSRSQAPAPPGIMGTNLESLFITAAVICILVSFTLIVQALDGARRFSAVSRSRVFTDAVGIALVAALAIFAATFRPALLGQSLGEASITLHNDGFHLIPLGLAEAAIRLDPANPAHLANAAVINEEFGMMNEAEAKRLTLERRMEKYVDIVRDNNRAAEMSLMFSSLSDSPLHAGDPLPGGESWSKIRELLQASGR
jgi:hypothetical protein